MSDISSPCMAPVTEFLQEMDLGESGDKFLRSTISKNELNESQVSSEDTKESLSPEKEEGDGQNLALLEHTLTSLINLDDGEEMALVKL